ncbi:hypothetical protein CHS0354_040515 [Potamilus streckersoni]|uniref:Uncharacterized protein n=1 Tax=Potamilus streckersoni TaxID=2493646 RepID=A0AAE0TK29_9BIVA|nr:hypothetical protein CHS0354_040515 [Potamilus streckersoni]
MMDLEHRTSRLHVDDTDDTEKGCDECTTNKQTIWEDKDYIVVAAIDLGTTYSNWACSFIHEYKNDPLKIRCRTWSDSQNMSLKAPTTILVREDGKTLDKFGYEAEDKYAQFAADDAKELHLWYYFKRFKMHLHDRKITRDMTLESENGKGLPALTVFALTIEYLKNDLLENLNKETMDDLDRSLIRWVLTVPAIWDESAKQFMREAAVTAGIPSNQLTLALEPEVASLYCTRIPLVSTYNAESCPLLPGTTFILIDAGGGTIDIIAHEVMSDGSLNEIHRSNGGAWGGTEVDKAFFCFLNDFFGRSVYDNFKQKHMDDYLFICRDFEQKKRNVEPQSSSRVTIRVPGSLNELFEKQDEQNLAASLESRGKWSERVALVTDKMRLEADIMKSFFGDVLQKTRDHLQLLFSNDSLKNVNIIMMVGGFSESNMLQEMVRTMFPTKKVIVPTQAGLAVLKGAILFGHDPAVIGHRICRFSYGVKTSVKFVKGVHREDKRKTVENVDLCVDIFDIHVHKGQSVKLNAKQIPIVYKPQRPGQKNISFEFYSSNECNPMYITDEGCRKLGKITVDVLEDTTMENEVEVSFKFGGTEIQVEARDKKTGKATKTKIDFI